jgi:OOP family OmpA-OmpF porin
MNKKVVCTLAAALIVSATAAFGAVKEGTFSATPLIGGYFFDDDQDLDPSLLLGIRGGYNFTKNIGVEAVYDYVTRTNSKSGSLADITLHRFGGQALYHFMPDEKFVPYLAAGLSGINLRGTGVSTKTNGTFDYGAGFKYFLEDDIAVRGDIRHLLYRVDGTSMTNVEATLGLYFQFGAVTPAAKPVAAPTPAPEPVKVVAAPAPPPEPVKVEPVPAPVPVPVIVPAPPVDSDKDGVPDDLDKCPNTPAGVTVDASGCPVDSDKDGVADYLDKCSNTPTGVAVDATGCPVDSDKDGVADYLDKCPSTPAGVVVDASGCPVDSDKDGVADYLDKCPNTAAGILVDATGCPIEAAKKFCDKPSVIEIAFDANRAEVKGKYHDELAKLGAFLKEFPKAKGSIEGHTDADGSKEANQKLSLARAENVRSYLIAKFGIDGSRITAKGHGSANPIASNKSASGKAKNRRIEAVFSCE